MTGGDAAEATASSQPRWWIYRGTGQELAEAERDRRWPDPPGWRTFDGGPDQPPPPAAGADLLRRLGRVTVTDRVDPQEVAMVNAAIYLRRPLLVTGSPGSGKSSLAYRIARELRLGRVLRWPVTTRTTLRSGLYEYDAIGRAQAAGQMWARVAAAGGRHEPAAGEPAAGELAAGEAAAGTGNGHWSTSEPRLGDYIHLGPLGTALLPYRRPRVLLIDELDKSDLDLPNDLLNVFEDGEFDIPELVRARGQHPEVAVHTADPEGAASIRSGRVRCHEFPIVVITSNGERDFPPAFLRRCLRLELPEPDEAKLADMVAAHFPAGADQSRELIAAYLTKRAQVGGLAADQLLNAVQLATSGAVTATDQDSWESLLDAIWHRLSPAGPA